MNILEGYKTYIAAGLLMIVGVLRVQNLISDQVFTNVFSILIGAGLAALCSSVKSVENKVSE